MQCYTVALRKRLVNAPEHAGIWPIYYSHWKGYISLGESLQIVTNMATSLLKRENAFYSCVVLHCNQSLPQPNMQYNAQCLYLGGNHAVLL